MKAFLFAVCAAVTLTSVSTFASPLKDFDKIPMSYTQVPVYEFIAVKSNIVYSPRNPKSMAFYQGMVEVTVLIEGFLCQEAKTLGTVYNKVGDKFYLSIVAGSPFTAEVVGCASASRPTKVIVPMFVTEYELKPAKVEKSLGVITSMNYMTGESAETEIVFTAEAGKSTVVARKLK